MSSKKELKSTKINKQKIRSLIRYWIKRLKKRFDYLRPLRGLRRSKIIMASSQRKIHKPNSRRTLNVLFFRCLRRDNGAKHPCDYLWKPFSGRIHQLLFKLFKRNKFLIWLNWEENALGINPIFIFKACFRSKIYYVYQKIERITIRIGFECLRQGSRGPLTMRSRVYWSGLRPTIIEKIYWKTIELENLHKSYPRYIEM